MGRCSQAAVGPCLRLSIAAAALLLAAARADAHLGPGRGPWKVSDPAAVGLSRALLDAAGDKVGAKGTALCLAVAKSGRLVLDRQYGFAANNRPLESYSAGKTITAAMMGVAHAHGLFQLDTPLAAYGVQPRANWSRRAGIDHWPNVTARHLLTQTTGVGE